MDHPVTTENSGEKVYRIVVLLAGRPGGNTRKIVQAVQAQMSLDRIEMEYIDLRKNNPSFCANCYQCFSKGEEACPHSGYMLPILKKIDASDGIILASPIYSENIHGLMKSFLDHTSFLYHRPRFFAKKGLALTSVTGVISKRSVKYLAQVLGRWGIYKPMHAHFPVWETDLPSDQEQQILHSRKIRRIARRFSNQLKLQKRETPGLLRMIWFAVWKKVLSLDSETRDYRYWKEQGWLSKHFYFSFKGEWLAKPVGGFLDLLFSRLF